MALKLWYPRPAEAWTQALPIGNGRLGAMVFGQPLEERLQLNEDTLWAGGPHDNTRPEARAALEEVRRLIFEGRYDEAHDLCNDQIIARQHGMPYQPVGDLRLRFFDHDTIEDYRRELCLDDGIARIFYRSRGVGFSREVFASLVDQVIVLELSADRASALSFSACFSNPEDRERLAAELELLGRLPVPSRSSYFGIVDLAGFPKDRFFLYQARWRSELRMAHILPHWNWPERTGEVTPVHVYSSGDEAELFLNGRSLGVRRKKRFEYRFRWDRVVYEPGELRVRVKKRGKHWASVVQRTTGAATKLTLTADRSKLAADGSDLAFVTARITDAHGLVVPRSNHRLLFSIRGPGLLVALDNGDATSHEPFQSAERKAFNGLALAVVRTTRRAGKIRLRVESQHLAPGEVSIETRA